MGAERKRLMALFSGAFITFLVFISFISSFTSSPQKPFASTIHRGPNHPPSFAYYIFGGKGDVDRLFRLMLAVYHPRNRYLLHMSYDGGDDERLRLGAMVKTVPAVRAFENVDVIGKPDPNTYLGSTNLASVLRGAAILLKVDEGWDWFLTLSAMDYPLLTQDDLSRVFSSVRRDLNFIDHTSDLGWKESHRIRPIIVDPGIYLARRTQIFHATEKRPMPDSFKVYTGSPWVVLSRSFIEYCIFGWDNLPRTLLMYSTNLLLPQEIYFHSVSCNSLEFQNNTVNTDMRYFVMEGPPKLAPRFLDSSDYDNMVRSGAAFAMQFQKDDTVLDRIDREILKRTRHRVAPGAWCTGRTGWLADPCSQWGDVNVGRPGPQVERFEEVMNEFLDDWNSQSNTCR